MPYKARTYAQFPPSYFEALEHIYDGKDSVELMIGGEKALRAARFDFYRWVGKLREVAESHSTNEPMETIEHLLSVANAVRAIVDQRHGYWSLTIEHNPMYARTHFKQRLDEIERERAEVNRMIALRLGPKLEVVPEPKSGPGIGTSDEEFEAELANRNQTKPKE
jgi:hypothetical protein